MSKHWDYVLGMVTTLATYIASKFENLEKWKEVLIFGGALLTVLILIPRAVIWWIRLWQTWRDRNKRWKGDV